MDGNSVSVNLCRNVGLPVSFGYINFVNSQIDIFVHENGNEMLAMLSVHAERNDTKLHVLLPA
jgi:hypothetical protein